MKFSSTHDFFLIQCEQLYSTMQTLQKHFVEVEKLREINSRSDLKKILLDNRGYANQLDNAAFWNPSIDDLHDPFLFPQMENAVARILSARDNNERIVIF
jgi:single-stranded-DNA-specific exonuclease